MKIFPFFIIPAALAWSIAFPVALEAAEPGVELVAELIVGGEEGGKTEVTTKMQGELMRTDLDGVSTIANARSGELLTIVHDQKLFMVVPVNSLAPAETATATTQIGDFKPTGRKETISGFACEEFVNEKEGVAVWLTRDSRVPSDVFRKLAEGGNEQNPLRDFFQQASGFDGVPIRIASTNPDAPFTMTVKTIRSASFPASDFAPPPSYKSMALPPEMGDLLQQMGE